MRPFSLSYLVIAIGRGWQRQRCKVAPNDMVCYNLCNKISTAYMWSWVEWQSFYQLVSIWSEEQCKGSTNNYAKSWDFTGVHYSSYNMLQPAFWEARRKAIWLGKCKPHYHLHIFNFREKCIKPRTYADWCSLMQLDINHYHKGKRIDVIEKGYAIIMAIQNTGYQSVQLSQRD